jgi:hypothetical protein
MSTDETVSLTELAAMNVSNRFTRLSDALEKIAANSERLANALEALTAVVSCATEIVEPEEPGGVTRCTIRTHVASPIMLQGRAADDSIDEEQ